MFSYQYFIKSRAGHATTLSRQYDNVFGPKIAAYCIMALFFVATPRLDTEAFTLFEFLFVTLALTCLGVVAVAKLKNCCLALINLFEIFFLIMRQTLEATNVIIGDKRHNATNVIIDKRNNSTTIIY